MNRRSLFGKFAAVAAAVAVAPLVKAEATAVAVAPPTVQASEPAVALPTLLPGAWWVTSGYADDQRAEGYLRGYDVATARAESKREYGEHVWVRAADGTMWVKEPPTFEAMQADCKSRGCLLGFKHASGGPSTHVLTHVQRESDGESRWAGFDYVGQGSAEWLADVDAWRRALHGEDA